MYDDDFFFVTNPILRYDLAQRDKLVANPDGSVDMYLQATSPGKDKQANWLPAPKGKFKLVMRIYSPPGHAALGPRRFLDAATGEACAVVADLQSRLGYCQGDARIASVTLSS